MKRLLHAGWVAGALAAAILWGCMDRLAGSEIGNPASVAVLGQAFYPDGRPAGGAKVRLRRQDYLAEDAGSALIPLTSVKKLPEPTGKDVFTDHQGRFRIDSVDAGEYRIEVNDGQGMGLLLDCSVRGDKNVTLTSDSLRANSDMQGTVVWSEPPPSHNLALVYGLERAALVDPSTGKFTLSDCPAGAYVLKVGCLGRGCLSKEIGGIALPPGDTLVLDTLVISSFAAEDYGKWAHSRTVLLNTTASGADVADTVFGFPLLVRLDSTFDFAGAGPKGGDLRFADAEGKHLKFEIESWDSLAGKAEVWVRLDTLWGGSNSQALTLYWGNAEAAAYSAGAEVFPSRDGYRGVWHLAETGNSSPRGYRDATVLGNHGTGQGLYPLAAQAGVAGKGQVFDGRSSISVAGDSTLHPRAGLTVELWANFTALGAFKRLMSKAFVSGAYPWTEYDIESSSDGGKFTFSLGIGGNNVSVTGTTRLVAGQWYHVAGVFDGSQMQLYVNGKLEAAFAQSGPIADYGRPITLGKYEYDEVSNFSGKLDEVRVSNQARSPAFLKLSFENQRPDSRLITWP